MIVISLFFGSVMSIFCRLCVFTHCKTISCSKDGDIGILDSWIFGILVLVVLED